MVFDAVKSLFHTHTVEVTGSNPVPPTSKSQGVAVQSRNPLSFPTHFVAHLWKKLAGSSTPCPVAKTLPDPTA
jgi:hypothetical protein